jgi:tetratricopeptide (TPR) repeat protein
MEALREHLDELREHCHDVHWLAAHADRLYTTLEVALNSPPQVNDAIEGLIAISPYMLTRSDHKRWSALLVDALVNAQLLQDDELQAHIWAQMGEGYYVAGRHSESRLAFETALERAGQGRTREMILAAYIGFIKLQSLRPDAGFNTTFVQEALNLARQLGNTTLQARLYSALTFVFTRRQETQAAIGYGQTAYACWRQIGNRLEMARAAFMLADAYRLVGNLVQADQFLETAASLFTRVEYASSYYLVTYETGVLYLHQQEFISARQWLMLALQEAIKLEHPHYIALAHHSLGIAQIELKRFSEAEKSLREALAIWAKLDHKHHHAYVFHALGYLEGRRGYPQKALLYLNMALKKCYEAPEMDARQTLERLIRETIAELHEMT